MTAQPHRAEGTEVSRSYGDAAAPPEARTLTPCVGLQRWVMPPLRFGEGAGIEGNQFSELRRNG